MPFDIPTLPVLIGRTRADLAPASNSGALRRADAEVLARAHGAAAAGLYDHQDWISKQILPDTCDDDVLLRHARLKLRSGRREATAAAGRATFVGQAGAVVEAGSLYQTEDGRRVSVTADTEIAGETSVPIRSVDLGQVGNLAPGTGLTAVSPVLGVSDAAVVDANGVTGGTDQETIEQLRARVIRAWRNVPHAGNEDDYVDWALEVPGVTRAWCRRNWTGPGTVAVFVMRDGDENPFPSAADLQAVYDHIEASRPLQAELIVLAPAPKRLNFQIRAEPDTPAVRRAIDAALRDLVFAEAELGEMLLRSHMTQAISGAPGENDHELISPAGNVVPLKNELIVFGDPIQWL